MYLFPFLYVEPTVSLDFQCVILAYCWLCFKAIVISGIWLEDSVNGHLISLLISWNLSCGIFPKMFCLFAPLLFHYCLLLSYINIHNFYCTNWILSLPVYTHIQMYIFPSGYPDSYSELKAISSLIYIHIKLISIVNKKFAISFFLLPLLCIIISHKL